MQTVVVSVSIVYRGHAVCRDGSLGKCLVPVCGVGESCRGQCVMLVCWSVSCIGLWCRRVMFVVSVSCWFAGQCLVSVCGVGESCRGQCVMLVRWSVSCIGLWCR